jgi:hypothetical protein
LNSNPEYFDSFNFIFVPLEKYAYLSRGVQVAGAAWRAVTRIVAGVEDLVQRTGDSWTGRVLSGRTIKRSGDDVYSLYRIRRDEERGFSD